MYMCSFRYINFTLGDAGQLCGSESSMIGSSVWEPYDPDKILSSPYEARVLKLYLWPLRLLFTSVSVILSGNYNEKVIF